MPLGDTHVDIDEGRVVRRYTKKWANSGLVNIDALPKVVVSLVSERNTMVEYIESLHNMLDYILKHNKCCDVTSCLTAGCTSSHK